MKEDRRIKYSKMVIKDSIIQLLNEKPISKITVKEICELADINRSTFYKYYKDPYDWLEQAEEQCLNHTKELIKKLDIVDIKNWLTEFYSSLKEDYELHHVIYLNDKNFHTKILSLYFEHAETRMVNKNAQNSTIDIWNEYFIMYGSVGVLIRWLSDDMAQSPDEVVSYLMDYALQYASQKDRVQEIK